MTLPPPAPINCAQSLRGHWDLLSPSPMHGEIVRAQAYSRPCAGHHSFSEFRSPLATLCPEGRVSQPFSLTSGCYIPSAQSSALFPEPQGMSYRSHLGPSTPQSLTLILWLVLSLCYLSCTSVSNVNGLTELCPSRFANCSTLVSGRPTPCLQLLSADSYSSGISNIKGSPVQSRLYFHRFG